jgi:hypothetical protein
MQNERLLFTTFSPYFALASGLSTRDKIRLFIQVELPLILIHVFPYCSEGELM